MSPSSEELQQRSPKNLGRFLYYGIGASTLRQLKEKKIIKGVIPNELMNKKPDGLVVLTGGSVKAVIEYKPSHELRTKAQIDTAINQELAVAKALCSLLIVTTGKRTFWVNAQTGDYIHGEDNQPLSQVFDAMPIENNSVPPEQSAELEQLIDRIDQSIGIGNNKIMPLKTLDPSTLAHTLWQKIWINTGKEPERCLYNVVELFMFKFLSDVGVLREHNNFQSVFNFVQNGEKEDGLRHYAAICRTAIERLFPKGNDGTTIINGTIFVNEKGDANIAQASLFAEVIRHLQVYDSKFGSFRYIDKEFKTRLYESFLRQNAGVKFLGQYFTPRNVVRAAVEMSNASQLGKGARICDPFCGVGGFLLELLNSNKHLLQEFEPVNGVVSPDIDIVGYDKGSDEKDDERTIILAKANMLIYFSDLLVKYHTDQYLREFSRNAFNRVFQLIRTGLGTFGKFGDSPYDLIITNPPYVTSGSSSLKQALEDQGLSAQYPVGGRGTESLAIEWIIRNLKEGGQSIVVVPDGLMNQDRILAHIKQTCLIEAIVSLPIRAFYSTPKKTYLLVIRKKRDANDIQQTPIFTYLVSEIGETRDAKRFSIPDNDLHDMVSQFNQFKGAPNNYQTRDPRCKVIPYGSFNAYTHWMVDRLWTQEEQVALGIAEEASEATEQEFFEYIQGISGFISEFLADVGAEAK